MRVAVIGNSHVSAIKDALPQINAAYSDVDCTFFALPGGVFRRARLHDHIFALSPDSAQERALIEKLNGGLACDTTDCDHVWIIGHRFAFGSVLGAWVNAKTPMAKMNAALDASIAQVAAQLGPDKRVTLTPAPYPAFSASRPGQGYEMRLARMQHNPERDAILAAYETRLQSRVRAAGYGVALQPDHTKAAAFTTQDKYLRLPQDDLRHMNAAFGFAMFQALAHQRLGITPA